MTSPLPPPGPPPGSAAAAVAPIVAGARDAHGALLGSLDGLPDDVGARPSLLAGWTVGHVLTHLARNAESHTRMLAAAARGQEVEPYVGGGEGRARDIEAGAGRSLPALRSDLAATTMALEEAWAATPSEVWQDGSALLATGRQPLAELPFLRWRETVLHRHDLGFGFDPEDWPPAYAIGELVRRLPELGARLPAGVAVRVEVLDLLTTWHTTPGAPRVVVVRGRAAELVAWLMGRADPPGDVDPAAVALAPW